MTEPDRILRIRTVLQRTGLSRSTLYRKILEGSFPRQVKISVHGAGWRESAVNRWIEDPVTFRDDELKQPARHRRNAQSRASR
ncbi:helix-turn-helix transcriptional regulator [Phenylobacterium montanum]|uniref:AlpA family phage regulatory protein n=1 Tax=Phenylobacterium montanum TaxID=2823693 RepID=A0A975FYG6_9CAUL|nr:AlpA family phage regulatory protein [Caulobacter sp. S6]QUD87514.1 AlpA family phage regulatory protein [Caulobacter sp. S6]